MLNDALRQLHATHHVQAWIDCQCKRLWHNCCGCYTVDLLHCRHNLLNLLNHSLVFSNTWLQNLFLANPILQSQNFALMLLTSTIFFCQSCMSSIFWSQSSVIVCKNLWALPVKQLCLGFWAYASPKDRPLWIQTCRCSVCVALDLAKLALDWHSESGNMSWRTSKNYLLDLESSGLRHESQKAKQFWFE